MIRVVLDTNVLVSALLQPDGTPAAVLMLILAGRVQSCVSAPILAEYQEVLCRPRFKLPKEATDAVVLALRKLSSRVTPVKHIEACSDADDNMFLECAEAAAAGYLVTGNLRHFPARWKGTRVVTARELLEILIAEAE